METVGLSTMFLSVERTKRWLPAIFLLLSLFLPWWMWVYRGVVPYFILSFPWNEKVRLSIYDVLIFPNVAFQVSFTFQFHRLPVYRFVSGLVLMSGLYGLSVRSKIRTLAGLLGIAGIISYFALVLPESRFFRQVSNFPYFGFVILESDEIFIWFLSVGFYLALAGSLMLLSPTVRTSIGRIKKRVSPTQQTNEEPIK